MLPVAAYRECYGVTIALPTVLGRDGAARGFEPSMSEDERRAFERSAATRRGASVCQPRGAVSAAVSGRVLV